MTCDEAREIFPALITGDLPLTERAQAEAHLSGCPDCRQMIEDLYRVAPRDAATERIPAHAEAGPRPNLRFLLPPLLVLGLGLGVIALVPGVALHAWQRGTAMLFAARHGAPPAAPRAEAPPIDAARIEPSADPLVEPSSGFASAVAALAPPLSRSTLAPPTSNAPTPPATAPPADTLIQPPATTAAPPADTQSARMIAEPAAHPPAETSSAPSAKKGERREARRTEKTPGPAEPERASRPASPLKALDTDVVVQISVRDRGQAERDVRMLLGRLGGSSLGQNDGSTIVVIPRSSYAEFTRGLAQIGAWRMEAGRSSLPDPVHVAVRLAKPE